MKHITIGFSSILTTLCVLCGAVVAQTSGKLHEDKAPENERVAFSHVLPRLEGSRLKTTVVEVRYGPGASSPPHSHPCPVIGYVIIGTLKFQIKGEREVVYGAGESFYEAPNSIHLVSANASRTKPVKFVVFFVCDHDGPLNMAVPENLPAGGKQP